MTESPWGGMRRRSFGSSVLWEKRLPIRESSAWPVNPKRKGQRGGIETELGTCENLGKVGMGRSQLSKAHPWFCYPSPDGTPERLHGIPQEV